MGYTVAKAAVHALTKSISGAPSKMPDKACVLALCPVALDTPANRTSMPKADTSTWTPCEAAAEAVAKWAEEAGSRPKSGALVAIRTAEGKTSFKSDAGEELYI